MNTDKQKAIELALAKLTIEEQELLGLIKKPKKPKTNYKLKINYMIGDANGHTDEESTISLDNPFLKIITGALDKLCVLEGHCGLSLNSESFKGNKKIGNINDLECDLLSLISCGDEYSTDKFLEKYKFEKSEKNQDYIYEFEGLFISETEYSFLVYKGYTLK
jgi:hypothetical protein